MSEEVFKPEIEAEFAEAMKPRHAKISARRAKTMKELNEEMKTW